MSNSSNSDETLPNSVKLGLLAAITGLIADAISLLSLLESIEELKDEAQEKKKTQKDLDDKFQMMQKQINELSKEIQRMKVRQR